MPAATAPADFPNLVDAVAEAALKVPGVRDLHGGALAEVAVHLPGRRVTGLRLDERSCAVHIAVDWGADIPAIAAAVRDALRPLVGDRSVEVTVEDIAGPGPGGTEKKRQP